MARPNAARALSALEFRFTDPDDAGKYGDGWYVYDEGTWLRMRARDLIELERELGMTMVSIMNMFRDGTVLGDLSAAWLGVRATDPARAGEFDEFNPVTMAIEWRTAEGKDPAGEAPATPAEPDSGSSTPSGPQSTTSGTTGSVALPTLPVVES